MPAFPEVASSIPYEGPTSRNPLAFKHYDADAVIEGKSMRDHLRFSVVYWHTFRGAGSDPFGPGTMVRPWEDGADSVENAQNRVRVAFEFITKLGSPYYAFHDRDVAPEGKTLAESHKNLDAVVAVLKEEQERTGVKLLWGTANLFSNPRYMHGAATSCNAEVFAYGAAQVKKAIEVTHELGGEGYTFWGGRHTMQHELEVAGAAGALGSIDANTGDLLLGWDTDQFPTDIYLTTQCMHSILKWGGLTTGGVNFDAKVRRESFEPIDLFYAHIGGMDAFARGLKIAAAMRADGRLETMVRDRYASWDSGLGAEIGAGKHSLASLEELMLEKGEAAPNASGRQELFENVVNDYL
ncbi:xylA [Symbiodinium sp. KB8]|nr:xylA [Symbiodinium sp. KB8]